MNPKGIASCLGIGYIPKGSGTVASFVMLLIWGLIQSPAIFACLVALSIPLGIWAASQVEKDWGEDSYKVVIDEIAGMGISLLFLPFSIPLGFVAFSVFRFFDIFKPLGIRRLESLPKGWGVMADDLLAGVYTLITMQALCYFF